MNKVDGFALIVWLRYNPEDDWSKDGRHPFSPKPEFKVQRRGTQTLNSNSEKVEFGLLRTVLDIHNYYY
jgi:hypothetical protein